MLGIEPVWASEIEKFPIAVSKYHFPNMKHHGSVCDIKGAEVEPVDIITFGSPCFPSGTLVITSNGYVSIEEVKVGDKVLTHTGRWCNVLKTGNKIANTIILKGFGHYGLECTEEHPFYSSDKTRNWNGNRRSYDSIMSKPEWTPAKEMEGKFWGTPIITRSLVIPSPREDNRFNDFPQMDKAFWWMVGRWLGDGWLRGRQRPKRPVGETWGQIFICCSHKETEALKIELNKTGLKWMIINERTVTKFRTNSKPLAEWLVQNFGEKADGKKIPSWVLGMRQEFRESLLEGYTSADGWERPDGSYSITTVSKALAFGVRAIAESLNFSSQLYFSKMKPFTTIENRVVNQKDFYTVRYNKIKKQTSRKEAFGVSWGKVRSLKQGRENQTVYNLEVEMDNSYIVENIIVHNCQDLSVAGKRAGMGEGTRSGLFTEAVRIIKEMRSGTDGRYPRYAVWENVPGAFSSNKGEDFRAVIESLSKVAEAEVSIPLPKDGRWEPAGLVVGDGWSIAWRTLDAQFWGVPQRRKRIFLVADFGGGRASEIFFERESVSGDIEASGGQMQEVTRSVEGGTCFTIQGNIIDRADTAGANGCGVRENISYTLNTIDRPAVMLFEPRSQDGVPRIHETGVCPTLNTAEEGGQRQPCICVHATQDPITAENRSHALGANSSQAVYGYPDTANALKAKANLSFRGDSDNLAVMYDASGSTGATLTANNGDSVNNQTPRAVFPAQTVRRLTPRECERLQGFSDNWTNIPGASDSARYKALGNSVAIPCVKFILSCIVDDVSHDFEPVPKFKSISALSII